MSYVSILLVYKNSGVAKRRQVGARSLGRRAWGCINTLCLAN